MSHKKFYWVKGEHGGPSNVIQHLKKTQKTRRHIEVKGHLCQDCRADIKKNRIPLFSPLNFKRPVSRPDCLKGLTWVETAVISQIQSCQKARILKTGMRCILGHTSFIDRSGEVASVTKTVPWLPKEITEFVLRRQSGDKKKGV